MKVNTALEVEDQELAADSGNQPAPALLKPKVQCGGKDEVVVQRLAAARASKLARAEAEAYADVQARKPALYCALFRSCLDTITCVFKSRNNVLAERKESILQDG